ncbi:hypothetical protein F183_A48370 [Bryobacterales bacterium F-183]|nr:hypothetical protein F183_A48370 [Bryobacterales bacterium F-183]
MQLFEEAVHLLRSAPLAFFAPCLIGTLPFALCFLWFTAEMSWSGYAMQELLGASLFTAAVYVWKQAWEGVFCLRLQERLSGNVVRLAPGDVARMVLRQAAVQPLALVSLPLSAALLVPLPIVFAFFRNYSLYAALGDENPARKAGQQASEWIKQSYILQIFLFLLGLLLALNYAVAALTLPGLAKSFFGIDNTLTRYGQWLYSWTGATAIGMLVYVTLEPVCCAIYVLRCFYGQAQATGVDLEAKLRRALATAAMVVLSFAPHVLSAQPQPPAPSGAVDAKQLERSVGEVLQRREFTWRMPRQDTAEADRPAWVRWIDGVIQRSKEFIEWFVEGLRKLFEPAQPNSANKNKESEPYAQILQYSLWMLGILFAIGAGLLLYRQHRNRRTIVAASALAATSASVDVRDESVTADKLPEDSWMALAREWIEKGDFRLALRAMHLSGLSYLNSRNLITVRRWKSGLEYSSEVVRRARTAPEVALAFRRNLRVFEAGWFGTRPVTHETLQELSRGLEEMRSHASRL